MFKKKKEENEIKEQTEDKEQTKEQKETSLRKFLYAAVSELWSYEIWSYIVMTLIIRIIISVAKSILLTRDDAITTSNLTYVLFSPQGVLIILIAIMAVFVYIATELFGEIIFVGKIFANKNKGRVVTRVLSAIAEGFESLKLFLNPRGILCLFYIFIITPIIGVGYTISLTDDFYIPNFIMDVIKAKWMFAVPFFTFMFCLAIVGLLHIFVFHGVLLRKESVKESMRKSRLIIMQNWAKLIFRLIRITLILFLIRVAVSYLINFGVVNSLVKLNAKIPKDYVLDPNKFFSSPATFTPMDFKVLLVRALTFFAFIEGTFIEFVIKAICDAVFMIDITRFYLEYSKKLSGEDKLVYLEQERRVKYIPKVIACIFASIAIGIFSVLIGFISEDIVHNEKNAKIIAHRTGGFLACENSIDGLKVSIEHNCFGAETDVQRTKDGYYIINHDDDFGRLTGVARAPKDMTLAEVRELRIKDTTGSGKLLQVPTLEEFLDTIKGKIKLFIELKGVTADKQMVDDVVRMVKEKGCQDDVVLISLKYDIMEYAEFKYGEMDTGVLCFGGFGNVEDLHVDYVLMEEEMSGGYVNAVESKGKTSGVWTVNTEKGMVNAFDMGADTIISDEINLYYKIDDSMKNRTEFEVIRDWCEYITG